MFFEGPKPFLDNVENALHPWLFFFLIIVSSQHRSNERSVFSLLMSCILLNQTALLCILEVIIVGVMFFCYSRQHDSPFNRLYSDSKGSFC